MSKHNDEELFDWIEREAYGGALVSDDNGHWAFVFTGLQNVVCGDNPVDVQTSFFIKADEWCDSVREAIERAITESENVDKNTTP